MALLVGGFFVSSVVSDEVYDPVFDTPVDANFIYQLLPSFYRTVMQDQELFATMWSGALQDVFANMLNLWQVDYAKSLRDVPVLAQRKWVQFALYETQDFVLDPELSSSGLSGVFQYVEDEQHLRGTTVNRSRWDKSFYPLSATVNEATSLGWGVDIRLESVESYSAVLFGYFTSQSSRIRDTLAFAVLGGTAGDDEPVAAILHFDPQGLVTVSIDAFQLQMNTDYRLDATYTAGTGAVVLSVVETRFEKVGGSSGFVLDDLNTTVSNIFRDDSVNFDTLGVVAGDTLVAFGIEYEILSVDGSQLTVNPIGLPVNVDSVAYQVLGPVEVSSLSLDLPGDAPDPRFSADQFGVSSLDRRGITSLLFLPTASAKRKSLTFTSDNWRYLDPTLPETILSLPRLQERITDPQELQYEGTDFVVDREPFTPPEQPASVIRFQEPPLESLWAEYVAYDEQYIRNNFGLNVGLDDVSSDQYKARVRGLYYAYFQGPTVDATRIGVHILVGLPIAEAAGVVESINPSFSGILGLITISGTDYLYPLAVGTDLQVGDEVAQFQPLSRGVEVIDYRLDPEWFVNTQEVAEIQKFHTFQVRLNLDAFDVETLSLAGVFVDQIKPTWKRAVFQAFKNLVDEVDIEDDIKVAFTLNLYDTICDPPSVNYDDDIYEGSEEDWRYDQGLTDWDETSAAMRGTLTELSGFVTPTLSSTALVGTGTSFLSEVGGPGPVSDTYLAFAARLSGSTGITTAGSNDFIENDPDAFFFAMEVFDEITISGEGTFRILAKVQNVVLPAATGEYISTTVFEDPDATFIADGVQVNDRIVVSAGPNGPQSDVVVAVLSNTQLQVSAAPVSGTPESETYTIERVNQLTLDGPLGNDNTGVSWESKGQYSVWCKVASVADDLNLTLETAYPFPTPAAITLRAGLLNNDFKNVYYDEFDEVCPDEQLCLVLEYTNGPAPGVVTVPAAQPPLTTTFNFTTIGDTYNVCFAERVLVVGALAAGAYAIYDPLLSPGTIVPGSPNTYTQLLDLSGNGRHMVPLASAPDTTDPLLYPVNGGTVELPLSGNRTLAYDAGTPILPVSFSVLSWGPWNTGHTNTGTVGLNLIRGFGSSGFKTIWGSPDNVRLATAGVGGLILGQPSVSGFPQAGAIDQWFVQGVTRRVVGANATYTWIIVADFGGGPAVIVDATWTAGITPGNANDIANVERITLQQSGSGGKEAGGGALYQRELTPLELRQSLAWAARRFSAQAEADVASLLGIA
jgi:hypothetical protein